MVFLITGGAGFIGINFLRYMLESNPNDRFVCLDLLTYAANENEIRQLLSQYDGSRFRFIQGDICDRKLIERVFRQDMPDIVVNFAAESHVDRSIEDPALFLQTNIIGTSVLLDACVHNSVRFHQISTDEVYGDLATDSDLSFSEVSPLTPNSPYSVSKASADLLVLSYHRTFGLPVTITRCTNNYGPYQHSEKLIPKVITNALMKRSIPIYGKGDNVRDWIHVKDHCRAIDAVLRKGKIGEIYNVGGDASSQVDNLTLTHRILDLLGASHDLISFVDDRPGHDRKYSINSQKMRVLGWSPEIGFADGLLETVHHYKSLLNA